MSRAGIIATLVGLAQLVGLILLISDNYVTGIAVFAISHGVFLYGSLTPNSQLFGPVQCHDSCTHITIDDGPDPHTTPQLLSALEHHDIKATFFLIGQRAEQHPELVRAIDDAGHAIGNHTFTHPSARFWCIGPWAATREITRCDEVIRSITGKGTTEFRSPVGHSNPFVHILAAATGKTIVAWSARGFDGVNTSREKVIANIKANLSPGAIIVMHEAYDPEARGYSPVDILEGIVSAMEEHTPASSALPIN